MDLKDNLKIIDAYQARQHFTIQPTLGPTTVPRASKDLIKLTPNMNPPSWGKACSNEMWSGTLDLNADGSMSSDSLDPMLRRFYAKKEEIITMVLGWLTCQAPDAIRPMLLAALQIKRLLELVEFVKCCMNILKKIKAIVNNMINGLKASLDALAQYVKNMVNILKMLEAQLMNLPNLFIDTALQGLSLTLNTYINTMMSAIGAKDALALAGALAGLAIEAKSTLEALKQAQLSLTNIAAAAIIGVQRVLKDVESLTDINEIRRVQSTIISEFGWMASGPIEGQNIFNSLVNANNATWYSTVLSANNYLTQQIAMTQSDPTYSYMRDDIICDLSRKTGDELISYRNPEIVKFATAPEVNAYHTFLMAPNSEKTTTAAALIAAIIVVKDEETFNRVVRPQQIRTLESVIALVSRYQDTQEAIDSANAQIVEMEKKVKEFEDKLVEIENIDPAEGLDTIAGLESAALYMTVTNDSNMFENFDGVTTKNLLNRLSNWSSNQWYDVYASNAVGTLVASSAEMVKIHVAKTAFILNPTQSLGLRVIINNGLWILDCYAKGDSFEDESTANNLFTTVCGRFSSVPTTPSPYTTVPMTYEQWRVAVNHPGVAPENRDSDYIIATPDIPADLDTLQTTYQLQHPITGDMWSRYLTQQEIYEREKDYLEVLQILNLSVYDGHDGLPVWECIHYTDPSTNIEYKRSYTMPDDVQIRDAMLGKKPYSNMQIPIRSVCLQFSKIVEAKVVEVGGKNINTFDPVTLIPSTNLPFAFSATWGFVAKVI